MPHANLSSQEREFLAAIDADGGRYLSGHGSNVALEHPVFSKLACKKLEMLCYILTIKGELVLRNNTYFRPNQPSKETK